MHPAHHWLSLTIQATYTLCIWLSLITSRTEGSKTSVSLEMIAARTGNSEDEEVMINLFRNGSIWVLDADNNFNLSIIISSWYEEPTTSVWVKKNLVYSFYGGNNVCVWCKKCCFTFYDPFLCLCRDDSSIWYKNNGPTNLACVVARGRLWQNN